MKCVTLPQRIRLTLYLGKQLLVYLVLRWEKLDVDYDKFHSNDSK
jgi:hypothetical protein